MITSQGGRSVTESHLQNNTRTCYKQSGSFNKAVLTRPSSTTACVIKPESCEAQFKKAFPLTSQKGVAL